MAKKKSIRTEDITSDDILSLYEDVLPLLYENAENINPAVFLNRCILQFRHDEKGCEGVMQAKS